MRLGVDRVTNLCARLTVHHMKPFNVLFKHMDDVKLDFLVTIIDTDTNETFFQMVYELAKISKSHAMEMFQAGMGYPPYADATPKFIIRPSTVLEMARASELLQPTENMAGVTGVIVFRLVPKPGATLLVVLAPLSCTNQLAPAARPASAF